MINEMNHKFFINKFLKLQHKMNNTSVFGTHQENLITLPLGSDIASSEVTLTRLSSQLGIRLKNSVLRNPTKWKNWLLQHFFPPVSDQFPTSTNKMMKQLIQGIPELSADRYIELTEQRKRLENHANFAIAELDAYAAYISAVLSGIVKVINFCYTNSAPATCKTSLEMVRKCFSSNQQPTAQTIFCLGPSGAIEEKCSKTGRWHYYSPRLRTVGGFGFNVGNFYTDDLQKCFAVRKLLRQAFSICKCCLPAQGEAAISVEFNFEGKRCASPQKEPETQKKSRVEANN